MLKGLLTHRRSTQPGISFLSKVKEVTNSESPTTLTTNDTSFTFNHIPRTDFSLLTNLTQLSMTNMKLQSLGVIANLKLLELDVSNNEISSFGHAEMTTLTKLDLSENPLFDLHQFPPNLVDLSLGNIDFRSFVPVLKVVLPLKKLRRLTLPQFAPWRQTTQERIEQVQSQFDQIQSLDNGQMQDVLEGRIAAVIERLMAQIEEMTNELSSLEEFDNPLFSRIQENLTLDELNGEHLTARTHDQSSLIYDHTNPIAYVEQRKCGVCNVPFDTGFNVTSQWDKIEGISSPRQFEYSPVSGELAIGTMKGAIYVVDHNTCQRIQTTYNDPIYGIGWYKTRNNRMKAVVGSSEGELGVIDSFQTSYTHIHSLENLFSLHVNTSDRYLVTSGNGNGVCLFDANTFQVYKKFDAIHEGKVNVARFGNTDENVLVTSSYDKTIKLWDLRSGLKKEAQVMKGVSLFISVGLNSSDTEVVASGKDNYVVKFDLRKNEENKENKSSKGTTMKVQKLLEENNYTRAYFTCDDKNVVVASTMQTSIFMCDAQSGKLVAECFFDPLKIDMCDGLVSLRPHPFDPFVVSAIPFINDPFQTLGLYQCDIMKDL
ncbi:hypothetical protein EIN_328950 [Entamoeba invadens IP1]|uniref:Uncharacterized protein n=1 Tax=Entamoeba invadens IP1 TaxID=370355 RepID=A0A0A1U118_ENTIV|nr:hypothetical protein EIN_328950 [Entamoeba invadens IP1]ELP86188.1 hypothetical protein EIN_328950 [Entamoeba invadens IP1]|eukprot:XP_004185534.1 hypothetical protein EIN_328950 [Entamoeba invadens IP1]